MRNLPICSKGTTYLFKVLPLVPVFLIFDKIRMTIEASMAMHMLVEFPLLFISGWYFSRQLHENTYVQNCEVIFSFVDWRGWLGSVIFSCITFFWMIPSFLDESLMSYEMAGIKYFSWYFAGVVMHFSWQKLDPEIRYFLMGNIIWMTATAGMLYLDSPIQLCVNYLQEDQRIAGIGLLALSVFLGILTIRVAQKY